MFAYDLISEGPATIVRLTGDLDIDATEVFEEQLAPALRECTEVELDFTNVPFVDSSGIGLLLALINGVQGRGHSIVVRQLGEEIRRVFALLQLPEIAGADVFPEIKP